MSLTITWHRGLAFKGTTAEGEFTVMNAEDKNEVAVPIKFAPAGTDPFMASQQGWIRPGDRRVKNGAPNALAFMMIDAMSDDLTGTIDDLLEAHGFTADHGYAGLARCWKKPDRRSGRIMVYMKDDRTVVERISARGSISHTIFASWTKNEYGGQPAWPVAMMKDIPRQTAHVGLVGLKAMELL